MSLLRRRLLLSACVAVACLVVGMPAPTSASIVEAMSLRDLTRESDAILLARVEGQRARYDERARIVTDVTLRVEESLHGRLRRGDLSTARRLGGVLGDLGLRVEGEAIYADGERVIVFARWLRTPTGDVLRPVGMSQGVLPVTSSPERGEQAQPGGAGLELVSPGPDGRLSPSPGALPSARGLDELLGDIRGLVAELHAP